MLVAVIDRGGSLEDALACVGFDKEELSVTVERSLKIVGYAVCWFLQESKHHVTSHGKIHEDFSPENFTPCWYQAGDTHEIHTMP